jgi:hypothetical protein
VGGSPVLYSETFPRSTLSSTGDQSSSYSWSYSVPQGKWRNSTITLRPLSFTPITNNHSLNFLPLTVTSPEPELLSASVHKLLKNKRQYVPVHFPPKNIKTKTHAELQFCLLFYTGVKLGHPHWENDAGWRCLRTGYRSRLHNELLHDLYPSLRSI